MAESSAARIPVLAAVCFLSGLAGNVLASMARPPASGEPGLVVRPAAALDADARSSELLEEIRALRRELEREPAARVPVEVPSAGAVEGAEGNLLLEEVRALIASFEQGAGAQRALISAAQLVQRQPTGSAERLLDQLGEIQTYEQKQSAADALLDRHLFWTVRDLLEHYGKPERVVGGEGGMQLRYLAGSEETRLRFWLVDGLVVHADIDG
jgi:hypothetical protein